VSKFERHSKKGESYYVYPHKHCQKCGQMIEESSNYCPECYKISGKSDIIIKYPSKIYYQMTITI